MTYIRYLAYFIPAVTLSLFCIVFAPVIALFVNSAGYLPRWLGWFQTVDAPAIGDSLWASRADHAGWSHYRLATSWLMRNPAYGAMYSLFGNKGSGTTRVHGNINTQEKDGISGYFLLVNDSSFQFKCVWHIGKQAIIHEAGWQIRNPEHATAGSYELAPIRFQLFGVSLT